MFANAGRSGYLASEMLVRALLFYIIFATEGEEPFRRKIHPEELYLYRNPRTKSYVSTMALVAICLLTPLTVFIVMAALQKERADTAEAGLGLSLALGINGAMTNLIKLSVGRPRPDFLWRCFPDGRFSADMQCTGISSEIAEGLKSFPSGHSSISFASLGFTALYLAGKLQCFASHGRGQSWRLCLCVLPLAIALAIAVSRTCDYHHHWQDVFIGSLMGWAIAHLCYRQYFPSLSVESCNRSYATLATADQFKNELVTVKSV